MTSTDDRPRLGSPIATGTDRCSHSIDETSPACTNPATLHIALTGAAEPDATVLVCYAHAPIARAIGTSYAEHHAGWGCSRTPAIWRGDHCEPIGSTVPNDALWPALDAYSRRVDTGEQPAAADTIVAAIQDALAAAEPHLTRAAYERGVADGRRQVDEEASRGR